MNGMSNVLYVVIVSTLRMSIPLILTTTGATFSVRAGISELGCEGMMIAGAVFGVLGSYITGNAWIGLIFAVIFGILFSLLHAVLHITYKVNQTISGMSVNLLGAAVAPLLLQLVWGSKSLSGSVSAFRKLDSSWLRSVPVVGPVLAEQNILFYLTLIIVVVSWFFIFRTPMGLRMRMVGENPVAAGTVGIRVVAYKYFGTMMCGALCGLGGAYLSMGQLDMYVDGMTAGRGYIAMVINAFGHYSPLGAVAGSIFFGFFDALQTVFQNALIPSHIIMMLPYILTLAVLSFGLRNSHSPAGVGKYHDE